MGSKGAFNASRGVGRLGIGGTQTAQEAREARAVARPGGARQPWGVMLSKCLPTKERPVT